MKIVINDEYGGFGLSHEAILKIAARKKINLKMVDVGISDWKHYYVLEDLIVVDDSDTDALVTTEIPQEKMFTDFSDDEERTDKDLIAVVEEMGEKANGMCASLKVIEIPNGTSYSIQEYDGIEWVAESHETWS